jgi:hypothetical protein
MRGASFGALAYLGIREGDLRMHLGAESGLTILDLTVRGAEVRVQVESPLAGPPGLGAILGADLRRLYGDRSVFALGPGLPPAREVVGDPEGRVAFPLADGSWIALVPASLREGGVPSRATLLRPDRSAEAEVEYLDPDADRVPREVRLRDLVDGHRIVLEIFEVRPRPSAPGERAP